MIDARICVALPTHPKTKKLIKRLGTDAAWRLVCLFLWVAQNKPDGDLSGMQSDDIELSVDWPGEDGAFTKALMLSGFLNEGMRLDMSLCIPSKPLIAVFGRVCSKTWKKIRNAIFDRDGWVCAYCGDRNGPFECDHIVPVSKGGSNDKSNLVTSCMKCNRSKGANLLSEWRVA